MDDRLLDLEPLERAIVSLESALRVHASRQAPAEEVTLWRDGVIQRFEYGFELAWKMLRRFLEWHGLERVNLLTNRELFRIGFEQGLLVDADTWMVYLRHRNLTSHLYDEDTAGQVFASAAPFLEDARRLLAAMRERQA